MVVSDKKKYFDGKTSPKIRTKRNSQDRLLTNNDKLDGLFENSSMIKDFTAATDDNSLLVGASLVERDARTAEG